MKLALVSSASTAIRPRSSGSSSRRVTRVPMVVNLITVLAVFVLFEPTGLNGRWLKEHEIPQDRSSDGITYQLFLEAEAQVREIIETAKGEGDAQKIRDLYDCFLDTDGRVKLGDFGLSRAIEPARNVASMVARSVRN